MTDCKNGCGNTAEENSEYCGQYCTNPNERKKVLDVTAKDWKKEDIAKLRQKVLSQGMRFQVELKMEDGTTKFLYVKDPKDTAAYCKQMNATIVKVEDFE